MSTYKHVLEGLNLKPGEHSNAVLQLLSNAMKKFAKLDQYAPLVYSWIKEGKLDTPERVNAAATYVTKLKGGDVVEKDLEEACGVGVVVTEEDISEQVRIVIEKHKEALLKERYRYPLSKLFKPLRDGLKWADFSVVKSITDVELKNLLGPMTAEDGKKKKRKAPKKPTKAVLKEEEKPVTMDWNMVPANTKVNPPAIREEHMKITGGRIRTRFPPEPNGYVHIGHAKSMFLNFGYARDKGGTCFLRYDDTNPEKESQEYIDNIEKDLRWLGHEPDNVFFSSDYFDQMYIWAVQLIKSGHAYVDTQAPAEMSEGREKRLNPPDRDRPIEESLELFENMRQGRYEEGKMTLRMKIDMQHDNPCMRDPVAYRIKFAPHPHVGDKWCVYPAYDFAHVLEDSIEHITHSMCTTEFEIRRQSYDWLVETLDIYRPMQWEFSRLNLTNTVVSKRKLQYLVKNNVVRGWDDPRLVTIQALRRRGYTPTAIEEFCKLVGITRSENNIKFELLEHCCRADLDDKVQRRMVVLDPLRVTITNWTGDTEWRELPNHPKLKDMGTRRVPLSQTVYIDQSDFRVVDDKSFYGLAPGKTVHLKYAYQITCNEVLKDEEGHVTEIRVSYDKTNSKPDVKGFLHWVSVDKPDSEPTKIECRLYNKLFKSEDPSGLPDWTNDIADDSMKIISGAYAEPSVAGAKPLESKWQFERVGYFCCDSDSSGDDLVFNMTVSLKESREKRAIQKSK